MELAKEIYRGGFYWLVRKFEKKRTPFRHVSCILPSSDIDLDQLRSRIVTGPSVDPDSFKRGDFRAKSARLQAEFVGQSELLLLNALCISVLRRRDPPPGAVDLFRRLWAEQGRFLSRKLSVRWQISSATTFADHGVSSGERALGMGLSVLFDCIKIHESERRLSGQPGRRPFKNDFGIKRHRIAFDMSTYSFKGGDVDHNMLARLWMLSEAETTIAPLAQSMLGMLMTENRTIFGRIQRLKRKKLGSAFLDDISDA